VLCYNEGVGIQHFHLDDVSKFFEDFSELVLLGIPRVSTDVDLPLFSHRI
jgi:hypothetical protein